VDVTQGLNILNLMTKTKKLKIVNDDGSQLYSMTENTSHLRISWKVAESFGL
jgi:hypothetical protein